MFGSLTKAIIWEQGVSRGATEFSPQKSKDVS